MSKRADDDARARLRECLDRACLHLRAGSWGGARVDAVTSHGSVWDLHGTVCTCDPPCPRKTPKETA